MGFRAISRRDAIKAGAAGLAGLAWQRSLLAETPQQENKLNPITKPIPSTGEKLPVIGLGTNAYGATSDEEKQPLREVLEQMAKSGGKLIDTAQAYGRSEAVIGELLEELGNRDKYFLATKTQIQGDYSDPQAIIDRSFKALRTERIDLLQIHSLGGLKELMPLFQKSKQDGRIRYMGISTSDDRQYKGLMEAMRAYPFDFIQVDYSIDNRNAADEVLVLAQERRQAVLINVPFGGRRQAASMFERVANRELPEWVADYDIASWGQFFLKYVVSHPAVTAAIPGTTKRKHLIDNLGAGRGRLPDEAGRKRMEEYWDSLAER